MKRVISAILLVCLIFSMLPLVQLVSAETPVTYVLDTDGIDVGETYLIVRVSSSWLGTNIMALDSSNTSQFVYTKLKENQLSNGTIAYVDGFEALEWTVESSGDAINGHYLVHNEGGAKQYLDITTTTLSYTETPTPLLITPKQNSSEQFVVYQKADGQYNYLFLNTTYASSLSITSLDNIDAARSIRFYKKTGGEAPVPTYTLTFDGNGHTVGNVPESVTQTEGDTFTVPATPAGFGKADAKYNYRFKYWTLTQKDEGDKYYPGDPIPAEKDITLYAQWEQISYKATVYSFLDTVGVDLDTILKETGTSVFLRLDGGDGTDLPLSTSVAGIYTAQVSEKGTYSVWIQRDGTTEDTNYDVVVTNADASADLHYYSVSYNLNGGTMAEEILAMNYPAGFSVITYADAPAKTGCQFLGWGDAFGNVYQPGELAVQSLQGKTVFNALWSEAEKTSYRVRYLEKDTYRKLVDETTVDGVVVGTIVLAEEMARLNKIEGYSYAGAEINGKYYDKSEQPYMVLDSDASKNDMIIFYTPDPDLHLHKDAILENDGTYTIEMDMFIQNNPVTTLVQQKNPLDIVLVLDQSSSLFTDKTDGVNEDLRDAVSLFVDLIASHGRENKVDHRLAIVGFANGDTTGAVGDGPVSGSFSNNQTVANKKGTWVNTGVFDSHGDFHVKPIIGFTYEVYENRLKLSDFADDEGNPLEEQTAYYTLADGEYVVLDYLKIYRHKITAYDANNQYLNGTPIFGYVGGEFVELMRNASDQWVLKDSGQLYSFEAYFTAHHNVLTYRRGLEGREIYATLAGDTFENPDGNKGVYTRKEVATGQSYDSNTFKSIYADAMIPVTMGANGSGFVDSAFKTAISRLGAAGETHLSYGMEMAYKVFEATPLVGEGRQRIVIVFTDGKPGNKYEFDEIRSNAALDWSAKLSNPNTEEGGSNALVYTIGLYGADLQAGNVSLKDQQDFLDGLSSNFPTVHTMDQVWGKVDYIHAPEKAALTDGSPYYVKVGDTYYPLSGRSKYNSEDRQYWTYWSYESNGKQIDVISYSPNAIPLIGQNGILKVGDDEITIWRKYGTGYNEENRADTQYYHHMETAEQLEEYFATLVRDLTTKISEEVMLPENLILRDIMGQGLVLTPGTKITVYKENGEFISEQKYVKWSGKRELLTSLTIQGDSPDSMISDKHITENGTEIYIGVYNLHSQNPTDPKGDNYHPHTVDITGYDLKEWYMNASHPEGARLVATITRVEATDNVPWDVATSTNHEQSGLWLPIDDQNNRKLLEAFEQPQTVFSERAYVLDYGKEFELKDWYFQSSAENGEDAKSVSMDFNITDGMNYFDSPVTANGGTQGNTNYGNVRLENGKLFYSPTTTQWGGFDQFYVFGKTYHSIVTDMTANRNGNMWNKVLVIPANNVYYEDSFITEENNGTGNGISGFVFSDGWETVASDKQSNKEDSEQLEGTPGGGVHGWTDSLADDKFFSDGSAHVAGKGDTVGAKVTFRFTGTGVDVYTRTNQQSGLVVAQLARVDGEKTTFVKSIAMDNLAMSGDYYQIPTLSFMDLDYGTYEVMIVATAASDVATGAQRYEYYLDGIRVYNPLAGVLADREENRQENPNNTDYRLEVAYKLEQHAINSEIRDIILTYEDFNTGIPDDNVGKMGAVFIDWIQDGQQSGSDQAGIGTHTYEVGTTFKTYGPKNEIYLSQGQAIVLKVSEQNNYFIGMKNILPEDADGNPLAAQVNICGQDMRDPTTITVAHSTDMYYAVKPINGYIVIQNASTDGALLALTKLRTTNVNGYAVDAGIESVQAKEAVQAVYAFRKALENPSAPPEQEIPDPVYPSVADLLLERHKRLTQILFADVRTWL